MTCATGGMTSLNSQGDAARRGALQVPGGRRERIMRAGDAARLGALQVPGGRRERVMRARRGDYKILALKPCPLNPSPCTLT